MPARVVCAANASRIGLFRVVGSGRMVYLRGCMACIELVVEEPSEGECSGADEDASGAPMCVEPCAEHGASE